MTAASPMCALCGHAGVALACDLMLGVAPGAVRTLNSKRQVSRGEAVFHMGDEFRFLHTVQKGWLKTVQTLEEGREQIMGIHLPGDVLDLTGITSRVHGCTAIALEDAVVCSVRTFDCPAGTGADHTRERRFRQVLSALIVREQRTMLMLGNMSAMDRLVWFLNDVSARLAARGQCSTEFRLPMTRREIGRLLGLELETVSRLFSRLQRDGEISEENHRIVLRPAAPAAAPRRSAANAVQGAMAGPPPAAPLRRVWYGAMAPQDLHP